MNQLARCILSSFIGAFYSWTITMGYMTNNPEYFVIPIMTAIILAILFFLVIFVLSISENVK